MRSPKRLRRTTLIIVGCISFLAGLGLARLYLNVPHFAPFLIASFIVAGIRKKSVALLFFVILFGVSVGIVRGQMFLPSVQAYDRLHQQQVMLELTADNDAVYNERKQLSFDAVNISITEPYRGNLIGKIRISGFGENAIYKGDRVAVSGKLYKTRGSRQANIGYAELQVIERNSIPIDSVRRQFAAGLSNVLPEPQAPFGLGLLIGQRTTLGEEATVWLSVVGLTHIIAVSGYNLTVIVRFVHRLFAKRSRYQTVLFSCLIIGVFLLFTGFSASIVRASLVCLLSLIAWYYGHRFRPLLLLLLVASITAFWNPVYLWSDIGWYLSFLAFFGVLILAPLIMARYFDKKPKAITSAIIETFCAQIMTLPLALFIFNQTSVVALLSNALVVPLIPIAMFAVLIAGIAGMISPVFLYVLAVPAKLLLSYILGISQYLSRMPHAVVYAALSLGGMIVAYLVILTFSYIIWLRLGGNYATITDENMI